jgi:hypothetical protein
LTQRATISAATEANQVSNDKVTANSHRYQEYQNKSVVFDIVDVGALSKMFCEYSLCPHCNSTKCLELAVRSRVGLASNFKLRCKLCGHDLKDFSNSELVQYQTDGK